MVELLRVLREDNGRLKSFLAQRETELEQTRTVLATMRSEHEAVVIRLTTEILTLKRQLFGPKAERIKNADAQQSLLDILADLGRLELDILADLGRLELGDSAATERADSALGELREELARPAPREDSSERLKLPVPPKKPKKKARPHGRQNLDESKLPVENIVIEPIERRLPGGDALVRIGEEVSSHLDYRPSSVIRVQVTRPKYLQPEQVGTSAVSGLSSAIVEAARAEVELAAEPAPLVKVMVAEPPELPISRGLAGPGLLALVLVMKYADHLPLYRQARIFMRQGVALSRSTLCGFVQGCYGLLRHLVDAMWKDAKANSPLLLTDACGVLVFAKERCRRGHFQVFIAPARHVLFVYLKENNGPAVAGLLQGFAGKLLSDASSVYHETYRREPRIVEVSCWSHARRGLYNALASARELALVGIGFIGQLYDAHDAAVDAVSGAVDTVKRKELASPVLKALSDWLAAERPKLVPGSPIEVAMGYIERQWIGLNRFLDDGSLRLDNNLSELELRHQKVGQKNWLFCATDGGADWNAVVVSLIASCRMHGIEPLAYLRDVLTLLPSWRKDRLLELAPVNWPRTREEPETQEKLKRLQLISYDLPHVPLDSAPAAL